MRAPFTSKITFRRQSIGRRGLSNPRCENLDRKHFATTATQLPTLTQ